jgi:hypothetical protein
VLSGDIADENNSSNSIRKHFRGRQTTKDNPTERTSDREATMTSRCFYTCVAAIAAGVVISIAGHDRAAADDCPAGQPLSFPLAAKGSSTNVDYKKAFLDANTALDGDYLKQKLAVEKANPCPEKCSFPDFYTDPATPLRNETTKASGRVKATEWREGYTVEATIGTNLSRMCYKTAAEQKTGRDGREAALKKKEDDAAAAAKKAGGGG